MKALSVLRGAEAFAHDATPGAPVAVLLCHGLTGSPQSLRPWADDLAAAGLTVRLPRLPGHGTRWEEMAGTRWADWLAEVSGALTELRATGVRVVVGGLSMGGALALRLAVDRPDDVAGLVLVNPAVLLTDPRLRAVGLLRHVRATAGGIGSDIRGGGTELAYDRVPLHALHSSLVAYRALRRDLHRVEAPLVVLRSAVDHVVPAASSAAVLAGVGSRDVRAVVLERSWHVATLDTDAALVTAATLELVERVGSGGGMSTGEPDDAAGERPARDFDAAWADIVARWESEVPGADSSPSRAPVWPDPARGTADGDDDAPRPGDGAPNGPAAGAPTDPPPRPLPPAPDGPRAGRATGPRDHVLPEPGDGAPEEGFVPPELPPLPRATPATWLPWAGVVGGPVLLLVAVVLGLPLPGVVVAVAAAGFAAGFVLLLLRLPARRDGDEDDGAVV